MTIYNKAIRKISDETKTWYRFQGGYSIDYLDTSKMYFCPIEKGYIYFSKSMLHHKYFSSKRLKQLVNDVLKQNSKLVLSQQTLWNSVSYHEIKDIISNTKMNIKSFSLVLPTSFTQLVNENAIINDFKRCSIKYPERADRRKYGGGYGLSKEWLNLLNHLTIATTSKRILSLEVVDYIDALKNNSLYRVQKQDTTKFLNNIDYQYKLNHNLKNPYLKYDIMEDIENILEKKLYLPNSSLSVNRKETVSELIKSYQSLKDQIDNNLEREYIKYNE